MLPKALTFLGTLMFCAGLAVAASRLSFLARAQVVPATVVQGEVYQGPPKGPRSVPLYVQYTGPDGAVREGKTASPFLKKLEPGSKIDILVDDSEPPRIRLPMLSELWTVPLAFFGAGIILVLTARAAAQVKRT